MENYVDLLKEKKYDEVITLLIQINKDMKSSFDIELKKLKFNTSILNQKIKYLQIQNKKLMKDYNISIIHKFSNELILTIKEQDFDYFKEIIQSENFPINEYLIDESDNTSNYSLLHLCVKEDLTKFVEYLISIGADLNITDFQDKWTPLMYSIENRNYEITKILLDKGADINFKDIDDFTPLSIAVDTRNIAITSLILKYKPNIDNLNEIIEIAKNNEDTEIISMIQIYMKVEKENIN